MGNRIGYAPACAALLLACTCAWAAEGGDGYIVKAGAGRARAAEGLRALGVRVRDEIPELGLLVVDREPPTAARERLGIRYVARNGRVRRLDLGPAREVQGTLLRWDANWDMQQIHADEAWKISTGSRSVVLAISDTGGWTHPQLVPNFWANPGENGQDANGKDKRRNGIDDDGNGYVDDHQGWNARRNDGQTIDVHYHGTHVSGTVGAWDDGHQPTSGVAKLVSLMEVPFIDRDGSGTDADAIKSIVYAAKNGAKAINASWGGDEANPALKEAIDYAGARGTLFVAAAGNDEQDNDGAHPAYPAAYDSENIITVASTSAGGAMSSFSNYGLRTVDLGAPGDNIYSTWNPQQQPTIRPFWYYSISGTSMAAPHVTGAIGLIYAVNPRLDWRAVKRIILETVTPNKDLQGKTVTGGELNVFEAVKRALAARG
jgi:subtilisin family serine protease